MKTISLRDIMMVFYFAALLPIAWLIPERYWNFLTGFLGKTHIKLFGDNGTHLNRLVSRIPTIKPYHIEVAFRQHNHWELLENLREYAPWGWNPKIEISGQHHIFEALEKNKGVILWFCPFAHADLVFKKGLFQAGFRITHLSSYTHGFSDTRFGMHVLNPVKTNIEKRYLEERCLITRNGSGQAMRRLVSRLQANEIVSITAIHSGRRYGERPFLGGRIRLAKGAPNLALTTGAALLPVFIVPASNGYAINIAPPLESQSPQIDEAEEEMISAYIPILEQNVLEHPGLWRGWWPPFNLWKIDSG